MGWELKSRFQHVRTIFAPKRLNVDLVFFWLKSGLEFPTKSIKSNIHLLEAPVARNHSQHRLDPSVQ